MISVDEGSGWCRFRDLNPLENREEDENNGESDASVKLNSHISLAPLRSFSDWSGTGGNRYELSVCVRSKTGERSYRAPRARGLQGIIPVPKSLQTGNISRSDKERGMRTSQSIRKKGHRRCETHLLPGRWRCGLRDAEGKDEVQDASKEKE